MSLPAHQRTLPHFDISEQGLRELELWLRKQQSRSGQSGLTGIFYNFHNVGPTNSWVYLEMTDHDTTTDPPLTSPFSGLEASFRIVSNHERYVYFQEGILVEGAFRMDPGSGAASPVFTAKTYGGEITFDAGAGEFTVASGWAKIETTASDVLGSQQGIYLHDTVAAAAGGVQITSDTGIVQMFGEELSLNKNDLAASLRVNQFGVFAHVDTGKKFVVEGHSGANRLVIDSDSTFTHTLGNSKSFFINNRFAGALIEADDAGDVTISPDADAVINAASGNVNISCAGDVMLAPGVIVNLTAGEELLVNDSGGNPIFRVDESGDLHGKTGKSLVFDL